jgi:hypothetical protein
VIFVSDQSFSYLINHFRLLRQVNKQAKGQELVDKMCLAYRDLKLKSKELHDSNSQLLEKAQVNRNFLRLRFLSECPKASF